MPWDPRYGAKFASICHGIDAYDKTLFRTPDGEVLRLAYDNVELESNRDFHLIRKPMPPAFSTFGTYVDYLRETLRLAFEEARRRGYRPLATCSSGYDSACGAALAAQLGCREAVTLKNARGGENDSGKAVAQLLRMRTREFERPETVEENFAQAAEFLVCGMGGEDYCYRNFAPVLRRTVLVTGFRGETWNVTRDPDPLLGQPDLCGCSLHEFRLWNDFIHIPVPTIGMRRRPEIVALSNAAEMLPYRMYNSYDRPIPRRVIEEAGVPRSKFGQQKKAASILLFSDRRLFSPSVRREYEAAVPRKWVRASKFGAPRILWELRYSGHRMRCRIERILGGSRIPALSRLTNKLIDPSCIFEHSHPRAVLEFLAALNVVGRRYRQALDQDNHE